MTHKRAGSIFNFNFERQLVTFTATDVGLTDSAVGLFAIGMELYPLLKECCSRPSYGGVQL